MSDLTTLLASLSPKRAIKEGKLDFLIKRYEVKLKAYVVDNELFVPQDEDADPAEKERVKKNNEAGLKEQYKRIVTSVAQADPTDEQNKNDFTEWLLKQWLSLDNPHKARWEEDTPEIKRILAEFMEVRQTPTFKANSQNEADINKYESVAALKKVVGEFSHAGARYELPELSAEGAKILYRDAQYILWKVTDADDLAKLSSWPPNNQPAWCTKSPSTAQTYLSTGPEYVAYKDGEPFFQVDPHDKSGNPQFMNRHNKKMHNGKWMAGSAADLLNRAMASGDLDEQAQKDLGYVLSVYKTPDLNAAETFDYLAGYLLVNGSEARKDPRFLAKEQEYVRPRYLMMEPDELRQMTNRYSRVGEATKDYVTENKFMARLAQKLDNLPSFTEFKALGPGGSHHNTIDKIDAVDFGLCFRLDGLFKKVFNLFDKEFDFSEKYKQFKQAVKTGDAGTSGRLGIELVGLLKKHFPKSSYYGADKLDGFTYTVLNEHYDSEQEVAFEMRTPVQSYIKVIETQMRPFILSGFDQEAQKTDEIEDASEAYDALTEAYQSARTALEDDTSGTRSALDEKYQHYIQTIPQAKIALKLAEFTKVKEMNEYLLQTFYEEMKNNRRRRYRHNPVSFSEDYLPHWVKKPYRDRRDELSALREKSQAERAEQAERENVRKRWSPKREYEDWNRNHGPDTPDPQEKTIKFILGSPSYSNYDKVDFLCALRNSYPEGEEWLLENARSNVHDHNIIRYMHKHHNRRWPEMEQRYPSMIHNTDYQNIAWAGQRIPPLEEQLLRQVLPDRTLQNQMEYAETHLGGAEWPELEQKIVQVFNQSSWAERYNRPERLAYSILSYITKFKHGKRWPEIEEKMFEDEEMGLKYVFHVVPDAKQRIRKMLEQHETEQLANEQVGEPAHQASGRVSSYRAILARFRKELELS